MFFALLRNSIRIVQNFEKTICKLQTCVLEFKVSTLILKDMGTYLLTFTYPTKRLVRKVERQYERYRC